MGDQWRALDANGNIGVMPTPERCGNQDVRWRCGSEHDFKVFGNSPREAALRFALETNSQIVEVRAPGELFAHEQVAAERKRCARWAEAMWESAETDSKNPSTLEAAWYFQGVAIGARAIEQGIREGDSLPPRKATDSRASEG